MTAMRLTSWQTAGAAPFVLLAILLMFGGDFVSGPVLLAIVVLVLMSRVEVIEKHLAGSYDRSRWRIALAQTLALLTIYLAVLGIFVVAAIQHWASLDARGRVAVWALAG